MALYESPAGPKVDPVTAGRVIERALKAVEPHLVDGTDDFVRWFRGPKNSFVNQVAKQKGAKGGKLTADVVRKVLAEQGWVAYRHVADAVHTALFLFRRTLPVPLNEMEGRVFERVHLKQDCFGGFPSLMLAERFPQLRTILTNVWEDEDNSEAIAVMHRLLVYYSEMAATRRAADRLSKARKAGTRNKSHVAVNVPLPPTDGVEDERLSSLSDEESIVLGDLAEQLRMTLGISCGCRKSDVRLRVNPFDKGDPDTALTLYCENCAYEHDFRMSVASLRNLAGVTPE
jgi:hypothetical protein